MNKTLFGFFALLSAGPLMAVPVQFTIDGFGAGDLEGVAFNESAFVVSISADTDNILQSTPGTFFIDGLGGTIDIAGVGLLTFTSPLYVFSNQGNEAVGFGSDANFDLIDLFAMGVGIDTYDLSTDFSVFDADPLFGQFNGAETDGGFLTFSSMRDTTFSSDVEAVAEPGMLPLICLGVIALAMSRSSRRQPR